MLKIENIDKIQWRPIDHRWEIESVTVRTINENEYLFRLTNIGNYKHFQWAIALDRVRRGYGYRMYMLNNNKEYDIAVKPKDVASIDTLLEKMAELISKVEM